MSFLPAEEIPDAVMTVRLAFLAKGHGNPRSEQVASQTVYAGRARAGERIDASLSLEVPADGPVSFRTEAVAVSWEIQITVSATGPSGRGEVARTSFPLLVRPSRVSATAPTPTPTPTG